MTVSTIIEFTHRMMTSLDLLLVVALCVLAFAIFPKAHAARRFGALSVVFLLVEALLGAGLVLFRFVAHSQSAGRAWYLSAHLINTLLLLGAIFATFWAAQRDRQSIHILQICSRRLAVLATVMFVSVTGALAALGDTLFPASSLASGMQQDFLSTSSMFLRLRLTHPVIAVAGAAFVVFITARMLVGKAPGRDRTATKGLLLVTLFQVAVGAANVGLLAPVWMQIVHLLMSDVVWIVALFWAFESLAATEPLTRTQPDLAAAVPSHL
jgi:heme A synthase